MREILFRGKRLDNGEWVEGYLYEHEPPLVGIVSEKDEPEASKWFIARTGFADWNMPRPVELVEVDPLHCRSVHRAEGQERREDF